MWITTTGYEQTPTGPARGTTTTLSFLKSTFGANLPYGLNSTDDQETLELDFGKELTETVQAPDDDRRSEFCLLRTVSHTLRLRHATWTASNGEQCHLPLDWVLPFNNVSIAARFLKEAESPYLSSKDWLYAESLLKHISLYLP